MPRDSSPAGSGDLLSRAKPLINAFAKKLHAVGGKQEQEGVGRARFDTWETSFLSLFLFISPPPRHFRTVLARYLCTSTFATRFLSSTAKRANLRGQFDRDSGPDSARPRRTRSWISAPRSHEIRT